MLLWGPCTSLQNVMATNTIVRHHSPDQSGGPMNRRTDWWIPKDPALENTSRCKREEHLTLCGISVWRREINWVMVKRMCYICEGCFNNTLCCMICVWFSLFYIVSRLQYMLLPVGNVLQCSQSTQILNPDMCERLFKMVFRALQLIL